METSDFLAPVDDFLCTICHNVMIDPCACSQGHQFCRDCISTWLQQSSTCPSRCGRLEVGNLTKLRTMDSMISKLQARCCHAGVTDGLSPGPKNLRRRSRANEAPSSSDTGCGWVGGVGDREKHLRDDCAYAKVECSCKGCDTKVPRSQLAEHEAACEHRKVSCEKCEARVKAGEMSIHLLECRMVEIGCPQECGARVLRGDLGEHEKECPNVVVCCSFSEHGCEVRGKRKAIGEHEEEAVVAHSRLAARRAGRVQERNTALEQEVTGLKRSLNDKTSQVRKLEEELEESKRQLASAVGQPYGELSVTWKIEGFTAQVTTKSRDKFVVIRSNVFCVQTKAGDYRLHLALLFCRKAGSLRQGYAGLFVYSSSEKNGCTNFPVDLGGTSLTVEEGAKKVINSYQEGDLLYFDDSLGEETLMSADRMPSLNWTPEDNAISAGPEPEYDVTEFLVDDALTVQGVIRITPPNKVSI